MSAAIELNVQEKSKSGKGSARAVRRDGMLPCVVYGGNKAPTSLSVDPVQIKQQLRKDALFTSIYDLVLNGKKKEHVLARDLQLDPVTDQLLHMDFLRITDSTRINVNVPVHLENEDKCPGIKLGGNLQIIRNTAELNCRAADIPAFVSVDMEQFKMGDSIRISHVDLPSGVRSAIDRDFMLALIAAPRGGSDVEDENEEEEVEETEEAE